MYYALQKLRTCLFFYNEDARMLQVCKIPVKLWFLSIKGQGVTEDCIMTNHEA